MPNYSRLLATPVSILNNYLAGGFRSGTMIELKGQPRSGKSTLAYQTARMLLDNCPDATVVIEDIENSIDELRLEYVFNLIIDNEHVIRSKPQHMQAAFSEMENLLLEKTKKDDHSPLLIIVDSLDIMTMKENIGDENMFAGGQNLRQRYLKEALRKLMAQLDDEHPVWIMMINQVYLADRYTGKMDSGGGTALKHDIHYSVMHNLKKSLTDDNGNVIYTLSYLSMDKSKFNPTFSKVPIYIDVKNGGKINDKVSIETFGLEKEIIKGGAAGYYWLPRFPGDDCEEAPSFSSWEDLLANYQKSPYADANIYELISHLKEAPIPAEYKNLESSDGNTSNANSDSEQADAPFKEKQDTEVSEDDVEEDKPKKRGRKPKNSKDDEKEEEENKSVDGVISEAATSDIVIQSHLKQVDRDLLAQGTVIYNDKSKFDLPEDDIPRWYMTTNIWDKKKGYLAYSYDETKKRDKAVWQIRRADNDDLTGQKKLRWNVLIEDPNTNKYIIDYHRKTFREMYPLMDFIYNKLIDEGTLDVDGNLIPESQKPKKEVSEETKDNGKSSKRGKKVKTEEKTVAPENPSDGKEFDG